MANERVFKYKIHYEIDYFLYIDIVKNKKKNPFKKKTKIIRIEYFSLFKENFYM